MVRQVFKEKGGVFRKDDKAGLQPFTLSLLSKSVFRKVTGQSRTPPS